MTTDDLPLAHENTDLTIEPELEQLLARFIKNRRRIAWTFGCEEILIAPQDTFQKQKMKEIELEIWRLS